MRPQQKQKASEDMVKAEAKKIAVDEAAANEENCGREKIPFKNFLILLNMKALEGAHEACPEVQK